MKKGNIFSIAKVFIFSGLTILMSHCKDEIVADEPLVPIITTVKPQSGFIGAKVTINGSNFDPTVAGNTVRFYGEVATIISATPTEIVVKAPKSVTGIISVSTSEGTGAGPSFSYMTPPSLTALDATDMDLFNATLNGELTDLGTQPIAEHGFIYSTTEVSSISSGTKVSLGAADKKNKISAKLTALIKAQQYYARTYAKTADTTVLSNQITFKTFNTNEWNKVFAISSTGAGVSGAGFEINGKAYLGFGAGSNGTTPFIPYYEYDPKIPQWYFSNSCPATFRNYPCRFVLGDTLYLGLGVFDVIDYTDIWQYNVVTKKWRKGSDFPMKIQNPVAFTINGRAYILGSDSKSKNVFWEYIPAKNSWEMRTPPNTFFIRGLTSFVIGNRSFIVDGFNSGTLWQYDQLNNTWINRSKFPNENSSRLFGLATSAKGYLVVDDRSSNIWSLFEYNPSQDAFTKKGEIPFYVYGGFVLNNRLYATDQDFLYMYIPE